MYVLKDKEIIREVRSVNNFGYILEDMNYFVSTDYKVLQSQNNGIFVSCMKMMYNGKIELYYITDDFRPMSKMLDGITSNMLINIIVNLFESVVEVRNNGFLQSQNIDISWDKIFVVPSTLKVKLIYLPINIKAFDSYTEFESELRASLVKLINRMFTSVNERLDKLTSDLVNGSMSIEDIYNKYKGAGILPKWEKPIGNNNIDNTNDIGNTYNTENKSNTILKLVAINSPQYFEVLLNRPKMILGRKQEMVDVVIPFNRMISKKHCSIINNNGSYYITDENSANKTYVNGKIVAPNQNISIKKGDIIRMANSDFRLV